MYKPKQLYPTNEKEMTFHTINYLDFCAHIYEKYRLLWMCSFSDSDYEKPCFKTWDLTWEFKPLNIDKWAQYGENLVKTIISW